MPLNPAAEVTVGIISFNHARWVREALETTLAERPATLLITDDASTDSTRQEIKDWYSERSLDDALRIQLLLSHRNRGLCERLNQQPELVDTEYFVYIAGDDYHLPGRLDFQASQMNASGAALSYGDVLRVDAEGRAHPETFYGLHKVWAAAAATDDPFETMILGGGNWIPAPSVMFRTSALRDIGGFDPSIAFEDYDTYSRLAARHQLQFIDARPLAAHRELATSLGAHLFSRPNLAWTEGRARTELKALGVRKDLDARIAQKAFVRVLAAYKLGADPQWVADSLRLVGDYLPSRPLSWYGNLARSAARLRHAKALEAPNISP